MPKLKEAGVKTFELDYSREDSIEAAARSFADAPLDILVNNAGESHHISTILS